MAVEETAGVVEMHPQARIFERLPVDGTQEFAGEFDHPPVNVHQIHASDRRVFEHLFRDRAVAAAGDHHALDVAVFIYGRMYHHL